MTLHIQPLQNLVDTSNPHCYIIFYFISKVCFIQGAPRKLRPHFPQKCKGAPELFKLGPEVLSQIEITRKTSSKQGLPCSKSARIQRGREQGDLAVLGSTWLHLAVLGCTWLYLVVLGCICCSWLYLDKIVCTWLDLTVLGCVWL